MADAVSWVVSRGGAGGGGATRGEATGLQPGPGGLEVPLEGALHAGDLVPRRVQAALLRAVLAKGLELRRRLAHLQAQGLGAGVLHGLLTELACRYIYILLYYYRSSETV